MFTHKPHDSEHETEQDAREQTFASKSREQAGARGVVFWVALSVFCVMAAVLACGIGKVIHARAAQQNGRTMDALSPDNPAASSVSANNLSGQTQSFPAPPPEADDAQDVANLHAREDLLLDNYSWADQSQGKVRIPIERAMELLAQRGLKVAPQAAEAPLMTGDGKPAAAAPLTNGFARTGYEQEPSGRSF
jgi:cytoskeletal protein RodZ